MCWWENHVWNANIDADALTSRVVNVIRLVCACCLTSFAGIGGVPEAVLWYLHIMRCNRSGYTVDSVRRPLERVPVAFSFHVLEKSDSVLTSRFKVALCHFLQLLAALRYMNVVKADTEKL